MENITLSTKKIYNQRKSVIYTENIRFSTKYLLFFWENLAFSTKMSPKIVNFFRFPRKSFGWIEIHSFPTKNFNFRQKTWHFPQKFSGTIFHLLRKYSVLDPNIFFKNCQVFTKTNDKEIFQRKVWVFTKISYNYDSSLINKVLLFFFQRKQILQFLQSSIFLSM